MKFYSKIRPSGKNRKQEEDRKGRRRSGISLSISFSLLPSCLRINFFFRETVEGVGRDSIVRIHRNCLSRSKGSPECGGEAAIIRFRNSKALSSSSLSFSPSRNHRTRRGGKRREWGRLLVESANEGVRTFLPLSSLLFLFCCLPPSPVVAPPNGTQLFSFRWLRPDRGKEIFLLSIFIERPEKSAKRECCSSTLFFAETCCFAGNWRMSDQALRPNIG